MKYVIQIVPLFYSYRITNTTLRNLSNFTNIPIADIVPYNFGEKYFIGVFIIEIVWFL